jgi:hypothetical protein
MLCVPAEVLLAAVPMRHADANQHQLHHGIGAGQLQHAFLNDTIAAEPHLTSIRSSCPISTCRHQNQNPAYAAYSRRSCWHQACAFTAPHQSPLKTLEQTLIVLPTCTAGATAAAAPAHAEEHHLFCPWPYWQPSAS